jgi:two-component system alkaline phosphatase synthesis response regulator PhoP
MSKEKVALVEDDLILSKILFEELKEAGYDVTRAYDGESGLKMLQEEKPDLVLLDLLLPKRNGLSILKEYRSQSEYAKVPVIILTNSVELHDVAGAVESGAEMYLIKNEQNIKSIIKTVEEQLAMANA